MAAPDHDVGLLTSSAQIFASGHTLPQIRAIHKALHVQVDDKATRLRSQVGGSYRELLGTAETIVHMRRDMDAAQATLAGMGARCGRAVVGAKVAALAALVEHDPARAALSLAARARLLEACARAAGRLLSRADAAAAASKTSKAAAGRARKQQQQQQQAPRPPLPPTWGERLLLASKVLVLGRLLLASLGETPAAAPPVAPLRDAAVHASIDASRRSLGHLRRRLRALIEALERAVTVTVPARPGDDSHAAGDDNDDDAGSTHDHADAPSAAGAAVGAAAAAAAARDELLRALCAHSLATTSGARDVLWQLLHVRSQAMALAFAAGDEEDELAEPEALAAQGAPAGARAPDAPDARAARVLRGLALYTKTLLDVQALLPHRLPDALLGLKRRPLLDDAALRQIEGLRLDVDARWCGEDVQYFQPYLRHDDLDAAQARAMLADWAARGSDVLLAGLQRALEPPPAAEASAASEASEAPAASAAVAAARHPPLDLRAMVDLRTRVLQLWIRDSSRARGVDPTDLLDQLRAVFRRQMLRVLATKVGKLRLVGSEVTATLAAWQHGVTDRHAPLWGDGGVPTDLAEGAVPFVRDVLARLHGRGDAVARAVTSYCTWRHVVDDVAAVVDQLRRQRWDADADDLVVEDEDTLARRQQRLGRDDPQVLADELAAALDAAFRELDAHLAAEWAAVARADDLGPAAKGHVAMYLVRVLREIRSRRPAAAAAAAAAATATATAPLGATIVPALHAAMADVVAAAPLEQFAGKALARTTVAGRLLWDVDAAATAAGGQAATATTTPLPSTPSPGAFQLVRDLCRAMDAAGTDLWSPAAVAILKQTVARQLRARWAARLATVLGGAAAGGAQPDDDGAGGAAEDQRRDLLRQWLLDIAWLRCSLAVGRTASAPGQDDLARLEDEVFEQTGLAGAAAGGSGGSGGKTPRQRITKAAQEYWKKTALLFGLLA